MRVLVPWKPVVLVWGLVSWLVLFGFLGSSVREGKKPFAPSATNVRPVAVKPAVAPAVPQATHTHKVAPTSGH
jgi:hypothetical protein